MPSPSVFGHYIEGPFHGLAFDGATFHLGLLSDAAITIGGVPVHTRVRKSGLTIHDVLNDAPNTCTLVMEGDGPAVGQALRITINEGRVLFAGQVQTVDQAFESKPAHVAWAVTAIDDTARANYRRPFGTWVETSATTIAQAISATYAPGFSTAGIAAALPPVSIVFDGADTFIAALVRLASLIGGYAKVEDGVVYLFLEDLAAPPDPIDEAHRFLMVPAIQANVDSSQLRTRVYGKGYGENILADLAVGESLVPIPDGVTFPPLGGLAILAETPDGAQSDKIAFTGVTLAEGGTLVGPGAAPTVAPLLGLTPGAGVTNGQHDVTVVFVTALGKSIPGPFASIDVPVVPPPPTAPVAATATNGTGPDQGSHDYVAAFVTAFGETLPGPISNPITTSSSVGQIAAPAAPNVGQNVVSGNLLSQTTYEYRVTFRNAAGETDGGAAGVGGGPGFPNASPHAMALTGTTGGGLTPNARYDYLYSYVCANGYETMASGSSSWSLGGAQNAFIVQQQVLNPWNDARPTKYRVYRSKAFGAGGVYYYLTERALTLDPFTDTTPDSALTVPMPSLPAGPDPGWRAQLFNIPLGPGGVTSRKLYRRIYGTGAYQLVATLNDNTTTFHEDNNGSPGADLPSSNTTGTAVQRIPVSGIPIGPPGTTARTLYRRFNGAGTFKLVTTIANNSGTTYTDSVANSGLGAAALSTPTAVGNQIVATIPKGASAVTARELYMSPVGSTVRKLALVVANNIDTTATIVASDATLGGAATEPIADTSGLQQPNGQVNPGSPTLPVAAAATFRPTGGWVVLGGGQVVRYTGISGQSLTGIPAEGAGAITITVLYGQQARPAAMLTGVTGILVPILKGSAVHIWVQRDDPLAQAEQAARAGGDGVVEHLLVDTRRGLESLTARCDADLALFSRPLVTVSYATRDLKTKSGKQVAIDLASPRIHETLTIQDVTITEIDISPGLAPRFMVRASSVRFSLEDTLRRLIAGGSIVGGSS